MINKKSYYIKTFGCKMNEHDSENMAGIMDNAGYTEALTQEEAGVFVLNTCSIRDNADKSFYGSLGQLKKYKVADPKTIICVGGCMMQQPHIVEQLNKRYPWVDIIFGTHNFHQLPELIERAKKTPKTIIDVWDESQETLEGLPAKRLCSYKALVNVTFGCNNFCTYCIVPYTRGRERSRAHDEIINEVRGLANEGVKELMLLGQNVNSYQPDFTQLIYSIAEIEGIERIRFMTSHPKDLSDDLIEAFGKLEKLSNYIHLPVQSGSNNLLKAMNRKYTREDYKELVKKLRAVVPNMAISTDIIVGFPGETEVDFQETLDLVKEVGFDSAFTFLYSPRKGTPAEHFENQIPESLMHQRFNRLLDVVNTSAKEKNMAYIGSVQKVLVEGLSKKKKGTYFGRTESYKQVNFMASEEEIGTIISVEILDANTFSLKGIRLE
jgi:tRNA-2-methylthio-N6-dimethylallyladenosine synthase